MSELVVAVDESRFRQVMGQFASGVTVVTTEYDGQQHGLTVSAFCSLSLRPPLVLICIEKSVRSHDAIAKAEKFAVNFLAQDQENISKIFASRTENKFSEVQASVGRLGVPLIEGAVAAIECRLFGSFPGGDHTIFIGEVVNARIGQGDPLIYFRGGYRRLD